jgi:hypothetical protein
MVCVDLFDDASRILGMLQPKKSVCVSLPSRPSTLNLLSPTASRESKIFRMEEAMTTTAALQAFFNRQWSTMGGTTVVEKGGHLTAYNSLGEIAFTTNCFGIHLFLDKFSPRDNPVKLVINDDNTVSFICGCVQMTIHH